METFKGYEVYYWKGIKYVKFPCPICNGKFVETGERGEEVCYGCCGNGWYGVEVLKCDICSKEDLIDFFHSGGFHGTKSICSDCYKPQRVK